MRKPTKKATGSRGLTVTRPELARVLAISAKTVQRMEADGAIAPTAKPKPGVFSRYDLTVVVPAFIAIKAAASQKRDKEDPRDAYYRAQADLAELKLKREKKELVPAAEVVRDGAAVVQTVAARALRLPSDLVRAGVIPVESEERAEEIIREMLEELTRLETLVEEDGGDA